MQSMPVFSMFCCCCCHCCWEKTALKNSLAFKRSLDLYFYPSIIEFRIEEKIHTKAVVNVSRGAGERVFLFSWERLRGCHSASVVSSKAVPEDLNMKFRSKFNHRFTNHGCLYWAISKASKTRDLQFFLQNVANEILKMFKYNMKLPRAAC